MCRAFLASELHVLFRAVQIELLAIKGFRCVRQRSLHTCGTTPDARGIGLLFSEANADEMLASYLGCLAARRSVVLLDPNWRPTELRRVVDQSLLEVILSDPEFKDAKSQELATASAGDLHALASMILSVPNGDEIKSNHHGKGLAQFLAVPHADETEGRVYLTTSGTTGEPKIVEHSQAGVVATVDAIGSAFSSNLGFSRAEMQSLVRLITSHPKALIRAAVGQRVWLTSLALWRVAGHSLMMQAILTRELWSSPHNLDPLS